MIRVNLLSIKETELAIQRRQRASAVALGATLVLLLMVVPYVLQKRSIRRLDAEISELQVEVARYDAQTKEAKDLDLKKRELEEKLRVIQGLDEKRVGPARVLSDLSSAAPEKLWLEEFSESGGIATLIGWALDNQTVAAFMRQLAASPYFFNVDLSEATQPDSPTEQARSISTEGGTVRLKRFVIKASLDYFGKGGKTEVNPSDGQGAAKNAPAKVGT